MIELAAVWHRLHHELPPLRCAALTDYPVRGSTGLLYTMSHTLYETYHEMIRLQLVPSPAIFRSEGLL